MSDYENIIKRGLFISTLLFILSMFVVVSLIVSTYDKHDNESLEIEPTPAVEACYNECIVEVEACHDMLYECLDESMILTETLARYCDLRK